MTRLAPYAPELAYYDEAVITQVDDGCPVGPGLAGRIPTSSASSPIIVAVMLAALEAQPGHRVCEIGTGTGYTFGYPLGTPYDRIVATAAVHRIPYHWVEQTRPGGRILLPWVSSYTGALVALTVDANGGASGTAVGESSFMPVRERRGSVSSVVGAGEDLGELSITHLHPHWLCADQGTRFVIGQRAPRCQWRYWPYDEQCGVGVLWLLDLVPIMGQVDPQHTGRE